MWDRIIIFGLIIFLTISASGTAGTEEESEIIDEDGDACQQMDPFGTNYEHLDIIAVWFVDISNETMNFTMKLNSTSDPVEETFYNVQWDFENTTYFVELNVTEDLNYRYGITQHWEKTEIIGNCTGTWIPGSPGYILWSLPKEIVGDPEFSDNLNETGAGSGERPGKHRDWFDWANGTDFILTWIDTDGDGIHNDEDEDDDNDGIPDHFDEDNATRPSEIPPIKPKKRSNDSTPGCEFPFVIGALLFVVIIRHAKSY